MKLPIMGKESVALLVPHKRSMLLLDGILGFDREKGQAASLTEVDRSNLFFDGNLNGIPGYVCFELMAQTISAYDYLVGGGMGGKPKIGFILGVNQLKVACPVIPQGKAGVRHRRGDVFLCGGIERWGRDGGERDADGVHRPAS